MSETRIPVALGERAHEIVIADGALDAAGEHLAPFARGGRIVIVSDTNVMEAQGRRLLAGLAPISGEPAIIPSGEAAKSWPGLAGLTDALASLKVERGDTILAFGGGVVGDLTGLAASLFKRGIGIVQAPTTLLAMVDSAIGGKTGINTAHGKNAIGTFHQPRLILIDPSCLATLPERQLRAGYAEIVKYALLGDADFFAWLEANGAAVLNGTVAAHRRTAIETCARAKAAFVVADERETLGKRTLLNLGHSFAHALELETGFSDTLLHGEAVAIGLALAFRFSAERGLCPADDAERVERHLRAIGLPVRPADMALDVPGSAIAAHMLADKKASGGDLTLILARGIGQAFVETGISLGAVADFLDRLGNG